MKHYNFTVQYLFKSAYVTKGYFRLLAQACETLQLSTALIGLTVGKIGVSEMSQVNGEAERVVLVVYYIEVTSFLIDYFAV